MPWITAKVLLESAAADLLQMGWDFISMYSLKAAYLSLDYSHICASMNSSAHSGSTDHLQPERVMDFFLGLSFFRLVSSAGMTPILLQRTEYLLDSVQIGCLGSRWRDGRLLDPRTCERYLPTSDSVTASTILDISHATSHVELTVGAGLFPADRLRAQSTKATYPSGNNHRSYICSHRRG